MKEHGLYKFVEKDTKQIVYIGKTNTSFKQRIDAHIRGKGVDGKFKPYIDKCEVFITKLPNRTETDVLERVLINKYKPILNVVDNYEESSNYIQIGELNWEKYIDSKKIPKSKIKHEELEKKELFCLFEGEKKSSYEMV